MTTNRITPETLITAIVGIGIWCSAKRHDGQEFVAFDDTNIPAVCALIARSLIGEYGATAEDGFRLFQDLKVLDSESEVFVGMSYLYLWNKQQTLLGGREWTWTPKP